MAELQRHSVSPPACRILDAMVWLESGRIPMPWHRSLVAYSANHLPRSGGFKGYLAKLKALELVSYRDGGLVLEHEGRRLAETPLVKFGLGEYWGRLDSHLSPLERDLIGFARTSGEPWAKASLEEAIGRSGVTSAAFRNAFAKLIAVGLFDVHEEGYIATEALRPRSVFEIRGQNPNGMTPLGSG